MVWYTANLRVTGQEVGDPVVTRPPKAARTTELEIRPEATVDWSRHEPMVRRSPGGSMKRSQIAGPAAGQADLSYHLVPSRAASARMDQPRDRAMRQRWGGRPGRAAGEL